jgi:hypothetical protein
LDPTSPGALPHPPFDKEFAGSPVMPPHPHWHGGAFIFRTKLRCDIHASSARASDAGPRQMLLSPALTDLAAVGGFFACAS